MAKELNGNLYYTEGKTEISIFFADDKVRCDNCPAKMLLGGQNICLLKRLKHMVVEIIPTEYLNFIPCDCPLTFDSEKENDDE